MTRVRPLCLSVSVGLTAVFRVAEPQLMLTQGGPGVMGAPQAGYPAAGAAPGVAPGYAAPPAGYQNGPYGQPAAGAPPPMPGYQGYSM